MDKCKLFLNKICFLLRKCRLSFIILVLTFVFIVQRSANKADADAMVTCFALAGRKLVCADVCLAVNGKSGVCQ